MEVIGVGNEIVGPVEVSDMPLEIGTIYPTFVYSLKLKGFTKERIVESSVSEEDEKKELGKLSRIELRRSIVPETKA